MNLWHHPLSENDFRQCLRIACGASLGFIFCKYFDLSNGVFFVVTPVLLLGLIPVMNAHIARQCIAAGAVCAVEVGLLFGVFGHHPMLMSMLAMLLFLYKFICMSKGSLFLFGATALLNSSIMLHFASYASVDLNNLIFTNFWANVVSVIIAFGVTALIPDVMPRARPEIVVKENNQIRHEVLMGTAIATLSFVVFQVFNLQDSMSAQATTILLVFPMHWRGTLNYAKKRAIGSLLGVSAGLIGQLLLYNWSDQLLLVFFLLWICLLLFSYIHLKEKGGSGVGFGGLTTLGILFGQYLTPNSDIVFSGLYRLSSILFAIVATLLACYVIHHLLNRFQLTRFGQ